VVKGTTFETALLFNNGNAGCIKTLQHLGFEPGVFTRNILQGTDSQCITMLKMQQRNCTRKLEEGSKQQMSRMRMNMGMGSSGQTYPGTCYKFFF
jgi:hypothetical protein